MNILKSITLTALLSLVIAIIFAFMFRLPIPMGDIIGPFGESSTGIDILETIKMVFFAWSFYGILGGFIVLAIFGGIVGFVVSKSPDKTNVKILQYSFIAGFIPILFISTLDYIIGQW